MWTVISSFFGRYLIYAVVAGFVGLGTVAGVEWLQKTSALKKLDAEQIRNERLQAANDALNTQIAIKADAIAELEVANKTLADQAADLNTTLQEITNAKPEDDGNLSPILGRTLRRLRGAKPAR